MADNPYIPGEEVTGLLKAPGDFEIVFNRLLTYALTQRSYGDFVHETVEEARKAVGGTRAFLARIEQETGELVVIATAGPGWTTEEQNLRLHLHNETERGITGFVALTGEPYFASEVTEDPHYIRHFADVRSEAAVPFFDSEGRVRGVMHVDSNQAGKFGAFHCQQMAIFANIIAAALAFEEYRSRERMMVDIGLDLAATTEIEPLVRRVVDVAADVLKCEGCSLFLLDEDSGLLVLQASRGTLDQQIGVASYRLGEGLTGSVAATGTTIRLDDAREDPRWLGRHTEFTPDEPGAFLAVPIGGRDRILGVLRVSRPLRTPSWFQARFTESDELVLRTVASQLGVAIENFRSFHRLVRSERMAAWGELSAKSAHMIGNRTFAIKGDLNELKHVLTTCAEQGATPDQHMVKDSLALVESMERGFSRLEEILREFRDFVMATQLKKSSTDINTLVADIVREVFPRRSAIQLEQTYAKDVPLVRCDVDKMRRALSELIENAVSFMPGGGSLNVATTLVEPAAAAQDVRLTSSHRYIQIELADTGPGIPADIKEKIFTPFFTSRVKGMGLGLSIVKGIIDAHHGKIVEAGTAGQGARFLIYLPLNGETVSPGC